MLPFMAVRVTALKCIRYPEQGRETCSGTTAIVGTRGETL